MGLLDDLLGQLGGGAAAPAPRPQPAPAGGGNLDMRRIVMALLPVVLGMLAQRGQGGAQTGGQRGGGLGGALGEALGGGGGGLGGALGRGSGGGGGLGDILGGLLGGGSGSGGGGLGALLEQFQRAGLGAQAQSWVGTGHNEPISGEDVEQVFGPGALGEIAQRAGLSVPEARLGLAQILPEVVDRVTPAGEVPDAGSLTASVASLIAKLEAGGGPRPV